MPTCREVTALVAGDQLAARPLLTRLGVRVHLLMCRHCRRYLDELRAIGRAVRSLAGEPQDAAAVAAAKRAVRGGASAPPPPLAD